MGLILLIVLVRVIDDPNINAADAGGGEFQVTTGLLQKANDQHLIAALRKSG